ncbi:uncharacterized protein LOC133178117 [Saccostrea echinata]|uniref:uncharacterized protein LOC133178117 n=1 Tax=Saccostrea echinata TaxID=191078 RepID=UPI002A81575A|nr:uncharacterized protein LOC133178117 [Saccostrea echinata]
MLGLFLVIIAGVQGVLGIYGGCMRYTTIVEPSGHLKVKVFFLNGWKIGEGPCQNCTTGDIGTEVTDKRKRIIQQANDSEIFGKWTIERDYPYQDIDKTQEINSVSRSFVMLVSERDGWEMESSIVSLEIDFTSETFDIEFDGTIDDVMTLLPRTRHIHLQVKVNPGIRNDTNRPNRSPEVLVKPFYSLELGKIYTIHLTSIDNDGDAIRCEISHFIESLTIGPFILALRRQGLFSLDSYKCQMNITVNSTYFHEDDTWAAAVTLKDYNKYPIEMTNPAMHYLNLPYTNTIGRVVVLMYFKITGRTDPPEFIPPTPANNQGYTVFVGGDFHARFFAKSSHKRKIVRFDVLRIDGRRVNYTKIQDASHISTNAVFISVSWLLTEKDIGHHILCANAEDDDGRMTVDLHCFRILIKGIAFQPRQALQGKPFFVFFPDSKDLTCKKETYCRFPVYATTTDSGGIRSVVSTAESMENVTIQYSRELINGTIDTKVAQVEFLASHAGPRKVCLKVSDRKAFSTMCVNVTVELPDPCASEPCQNSGRCLPFHDYSGFNCVCTGLGFTGSFCEKRIDVCASYPCGFGNTCVSVPVYPYFFCLCQYGKAGNLCEKEFSENCVSSSKCRNDAWCYSIRNLTETCICRLGFHGTNCSDDRDNRTNLSYIENKFTDSVLPKTAICYISLPCPIPFTVTGHTSSKPLIVPGFITSSLKITRIDLQNSESSGRIIHGIAEVIGSSLGKANLCLDSVEKSEYVRIQDEICIEIVVRNGHYHKDVKVSPQFLKPTFEDKSVFQCNVGKYCHLNLWAKNAITERNCPSLSSDVDVDKGVFIISPKNQTISPCMYDVVFKKDKPSNISCCFTLMGHGSLQFRKRCYTIQFSPILSVKGSCAKQSCCNNGFCDGHKTTRACLCRAGFSGESCSSETSVPPANNEINIQYPLFGNLLLPKRMNCTLNEDCHVQILVSERTGFYVTTSTDPSSIEVKEINETRLSGDYLVTVIVIPKKNGSHQLCVNVSPDAYSNETDKVCFSISSLSPDSDSGDICIDVSVDDCHNPPALNNICSDPTTAVFCRVPSKGLHNIEKQIFIRPSPTNSSSFSCSPGLECHMLLYLRQNSNNRCPDVSVLPTTEIMVHIFNTTDDNACSVDVLLKSLGAHSGKKVELCIEATSDGTSEIRCYAVEYEETLVTAYIVKTTLSMMDLCLPNFRSVCQLYCPTDFARAAFHCNHRKDKCKAATNHKDKYKATTNHKDKYKATTNHKDKYKAATNHKDKYKAATNHKDKYKYKAATNHKDKYKATTNHKDKYKAATNHKVKYKATTNHKDKYKAATNHKDKYKATT